MFMVYIIEMRNNNNLRMADIIKPVLKLVQKKELT